MEDTLKDYILDHRSDNPSLNFIIDIVLSRIRSGTPYVAGGLLDQPYFLTAYVERWIRESLDELKALAPKKPTPSSPEDMDLFLELLRGA